MIHVETPTSRLILVEFSNPLTMDDVKPFLKQVVEFLDQSPGGGMTLCDLRRASGFSPPVADTLTALMRKDNPRMLRNACLLADGASLFAVQILDMLREAGGKTRRAFTEADGAAAWLGELLDPAEREALTQFLARP
jgi:hypothetical protein